MIRGCGCGEKPPLRSRALWFISGLAFALTPKCPMCVASWIAATSGLAVSMHGASLIRGTILALSAVTFGSLTIGEVHRYMARKRRLRNVGVPLDG